jgi:hypothetical protein
MDRIRFGLALLLAACNAVGALPDGSSGDLGVVAGVGQACINPGATPPAGASISAPALECPSRLCLLQPSCSTCTAACNTDEDCVAADRTACPGGFACAPAVATGPYRCQKLCVCAADARPMLACP